MNLFLLYAKYGKFIMTITNRVYAIRAELTNESGLPQYPIHTLVPQLTSHHHLSGTLLSLMVIADETWIRYYLLDRSMVGWLTVCLTVIIVITDNCTLELVVSRIRTFLFTYIIEFCWELEHILNLWCDTCQSALRLPAVYSLSVSIGFQIWETVLSHFEEEYFVRVLLFSDLILKTIKEWSLQHRTLRC